MRRVWIGVAAGAGVVVVAAALYVQASGRGICFAASDARDFLGIWTSKAVSQEGPDAIFVYADGGKIFVRTASACSGAPCDAAGGPAPARLCAVAPFSSRATSLMFDVELGYAMDHDVLERRADGARELLVTTQWIIEDGGPRPDSHAQLVFVRSRQKLPKDVRHGPIL